MTKGKSPGLNAAIVFGITGKNDHDDCHKNRYSQNSTVAQILIATTVARAVEKV